MTRTLRPFWMPGPSLGLGFLLMACGSPVAPAADSGPMTPDSGTDAAASVAPPEIPWRAAGVPPINLTPCPDGWREVTDGAGVKECDPYPAGGPEACDAGEAHFPGEPGCRPIGDPCPAGDYAAILPTDEQIIYVKAGAPAGGDGSIDTPFGAVSELNWSLVGADTTIALAKGDYEGPLLLPAGSRVVGACVRDTVLTLRTMDVFAPILVTSNGEAVVVENLMVRDPLQAGAVITENRNLTLRGVAFEGARLVTISADVGATLTLEDVVIRDTLPDPTEGILGRAIEFIRGAHFTATRLIVEGSRNDAIVAMGRRAVATFTDVVIRNTQAQESDGTSGRGIALSGGIQFEGTRISFTNNREVAILVSGEGTTVTLTDAVIRDTAAQLSDDLRGRGVEVQDGSHFIATRLVVADNHETGIMASGAGTTVVLTDTVVRSTKPSPGTGLAGRGIQVWTGAHLEAVRLVVWDNHDMAVRVRDPGSSLTLTDVAIRETRPHASRIFQGLGLLLEEGTSFSATRLVVAKSHEMGVMAFGEGTTLTFTDVVVEDTLPGQLDGRWGRGVQVQGGALLDGERIVIDGARQVGLMAVNGAKADLRDISVTNVQEAACASTTCPAEASGFAVAAVNGALRLEGFRVEDPAICGVFVAAQRERGELGAVTAVDLRSGIITGAAIGACVQVDGYDLSRLSETVRYIGNETNLDSTMLPIPAATGPR